MKINGKEKAGLYDAIKYSKPVTSNNDVNDTLNLEASRKERQNATANCRVLQIITHECEQKQGHYD